MGFSFKNIFLDVKWGSFGSGTHLLVFSGKSGIFCGFLLSLLGKSGFLLFGQSGLFSSELSLLGSFFLGSLHIGIGFLFSTIGFESGFFFLKIKAFLFAVGFEFDLSVFLSFCFGLSLLSG